MHIVVDKVKCRVCLARAVILHRQEGRSIAIEPTNFRFRAGDRILIGARGVVVQRETVSRVFLRIFPGTDR